MTRRHLVTVAMAIGLGLGGSSLLAGCGSDGDATVGVEPSSGADEVQGPQTSEGAVAGGDVRPAEASEAGAEAGNDGGGTIDGVADIAAEVVASPLGLFLGDETYGAERSPEAAARRLDIERERQAAMVECMTAAGFEYMAVEPRQSTFASGPAAEDDREEWARNWGFGISTKRFSQSEVGPDLIGHDRPLTAQDQGLDPNLAIASALNPGQLEAYFAALYGDDGSAGGGTQSLEFELGGCLGEAALASAANSLAFYEEFAAELNTLYEEVAGDGRLIQAEEAVRLCVTEKGLDYLGPDDRFRHFDASLSRLAEEVTHPSGALSDQEMAVLSAVEVDELMRRPREVSAAGLERLGIIQVEEVALAVAVEECDGGRKLTALRSLVTAEYEKLFIGTNADRLASFMAG